MKTKDPSDITEHPQSTEVVTDSFVKIYKL